VRVADLQLDTHTYTRAEIDSLERIRASLECSGNLVSLATILGIQLPLK